MIALPLHASTELRAADRHPWAAGIAWICTAAGVLLTLGCASTASVDHETGVVTVVALQSRLVPNESTMREAARGCALIGDELTPRFVAAYHVYEGIQFTFRCEFEPAPTADRESQSV